MSRLVIAVDVGGTKIAGALIDRKGHILLERRVPTLAMEGGQKVLQRVHELIDLLLGESYSQSLGEVAAIGIGTAGQIDDAGTVVSATDNLPEYVGCEIKASCEVKFGLPTYVENDANAAAVGELVFGAGRGVDDFVCITLGTGVGGGIISGGKLLKGAHFCAGELGHMSIEWDGRPCNCGSRGCLEAYVSGPAISAIATEQYKRRGRLPGKGAAVSGGTQDSTERISSEELFAAAGDGDPLAREVVQMIGTYLGCGLASICNILNPELIVVGGGVSEAGELLLAPAREILKQRTLAGIRDHVRLIPGALGSKSGILGAGALAWQGVDREPDRIPALT